MLFELSDFGVDRSAPIHAQSHDDVRLVGNQGVTTSVTGKQPSASTLHMGSLSALNQASNLVGSVASDGLNAGEVAAGLGALVRLRAAVDAAEARLIAHAQSFDSTEVDAERVLRSSGCSVASIKRSTGRARSLASMPQVAESLAAGEITAEHADVLARAADHAGAQTVDSCEELLRVARSSNLERTKRVTSQWLRANSAGLTVGEQHDRQRRLRTLTFGRTDEGMLRATVLMDTAGGAALRAIIDDTAQRFFDADRTDNRPNAPECRSYGQCRVDALEALLGLDIHRATQRWYDEDPHRLWDNLSADWKGPRPPTLPPLTPTHQNTLAQPTHTPTVHSSAVLPRADGLRRRNQILIVADLRAALGDETAHIEIADSGPLPLQVFERLACGADIYGTVFDGPGTPLWHGRRARTITNAQWRTLIARDQRCVLCDTGPQWCEAHHIIPWQQPARGPTNIDNLALLCSRCHSQLHETRATLRHNKQHGWHLHHQPQRK